MSNQVYDAVKIGSKAKGPAKAVLLCIADHADHDGGGAFPSVTTLAGETGLSVSTVRRALRRLEELGELFTDAGGGRKSNRYRVMVDPPQRPGTTIDVTGHPGQADRRAAIEPSSTAAARELEPEIDERDEPALAEFVRCRPNLTHPRRVWARSLSEPERADWRERAKPVRAPALQPVERLAGPGRPWVPPGGWRALVASASPS